jgi:hypothetical protein
MQYDICFSNPISQQAAGQWRPCSPYLAGKSHLHGIPSVPSCPVTFAYGQRKKLFLRMRGAVVQLECRQAPGGLLRKADNTLLHM